MREEDASLMIIRHSVSQLEDQQKQQVISCVAALRQTMSAFNREDAELALMVVAAEVAADEQPGTETEI